MPVTSHAQRLSAHIPQLCGEQTARVRRYARTRRSMQNPDRATVPGGRGFAWTADLPTAGQWRLTTINVTMRRAR